MNIVDFPLTLPKTNIDQTIPLTRDDPADAAKPASQRRQWELTPAQYAELTARVTGMDFYVYRPPSRAVVLHLTMAGSQLSFTPRSDGGYGVRIEASNASTANLPLRATYELVFTEGRPGHPLGDFIWAFCGGQLPVGDGVGGP